MKSVFELGRIENKSRRLGIFRELEHIAFRKIAFKDTHNFITLKNLEHLEPAF